MNQLIEAFTKKDLDGTMVHFAPDPDVVMIGSGADEKGIGLTEIKALVERAFAQSEEISVQLGWYSVSSAGSVAWVASDAVIQVKISGQEISLPIRLTVVLEQRRGRWLVVQWHDSLPAAGQKEGESWPTGSLEER